MENSSTRKIVWLSSIAKKNEHRISNLEKKLAKFYFSNPDYYTNIDFTSGNWNNKKESGYIDIAHSITGKDKILEVGCGAANILRFHPAVEDNYWGCDFSADLINSNSQKYPKARFKCLNQPNILPYENKQFDVVFSVFVIEHSANPSLFLKECVRVLKENGILIILCPDFLGRGRMSSQRSGLSRGTTKDKLKEKKMFDALITYIDNKIKIPLHCLFLSIVAGQSPKFYINIYPTLFSDVFIPDVDAVYVTYKKEIIRYLQDIMQLEINPRIISQYERSKKLIYLKFKKC